MLSQVIKSAKKYTSEQESEFEPSGIDLVDLMGARTYIREYRTFHFDMPRRCGKSTAISKLWKSGDLLVLRNQCDINNKLFDHINAKMTVGAPSYPNYSSYRVVWMDEVSYRHRGAIIDKLFKDDRIDQNSLIISIGTP